MEGFVVGLALGAGVGLLVGVFLALEVIPRLVDSGHRLAAATVPLILAVALLAVALPR